METAAKLRAEAQHLRALSRYVTDLKASAELHAIIQALEERARTLGNGHARFSDTC
jgi:hypothetical protein